MNVGQPLPHESATGHTTAEAVFIDDLPPVAGELFVDFVGSPSPNGRLLGVDIAKARLVDGVVGVFTRDDVPGSNLFGAIVADEPFLADDRVHYLGQPVVVIAATTREAAARACALVQVHVEDEPSIDSIDEAIHRESFLGKPRRIARGDFAAAWPHAPHQLDGTIDIGGQEQFYFESQVAIAYPGEGGHLRVHASTQNPTDIQATVAQVLGLGMHEVVCECRRMGGAFGGKETQAAIPSLMAALVAMKTGRTARVIYDKNRDLLVTGKRHAYRCFWEVGFDNDGRLLCARLRFFSNGGCATDLSPAVLDRTLMHAENAYFIPDIEIHGRVCRTNLPPNTAFRGFGAPQAVSAIENAVQEVAITLGKDAYEVRMLNGYGVTDRNVTPYGQVVEANALPRILDELSHSCDYRQRLQKVEHFNKTSRSHLRGIAMTPVKFGISFTTKFLNQANALVNVYTDGTIQVSTGATEMGQGVHTKIRQIVADQFGLGVDSVSVMLTSTEKNNNTSPTAASASTDLNGSAAAHACEQIRERLARLAAEILSSRKQDLPCDPSRIRFAGGTVFDERIPGESLSFGDLTQRARHERVDLGARGFYATPEIDFDPASGQGRPYLYFTTGAAVSEVLVDRFTGELTVERVDLLMDIGRTMNPGVDRGQVIGGFMQGLGWVTTEELCYEGARLTSSSVSTYKIPAITDLPADFRLQLLEGEGNRKNLWGARAVGEPPLLLAVSVWIAVKHALSCVRPGSVPQLGLPATPERILLCLSGLQQGAAGDNPEGNATRGAAPQAVRPIKD